jgi:hypothetical protein
MGWLEAGASEDRETLRQACPACKESEEKPRYSACWNWFDLISCEILISGDFEQAEGWLAALQEYATGYNGQNFRCLTGMQNRFAFY